MENLLDALQHYSPDMPFMLGHRFPTIVQNGFFSGGAGYVLSREALKNIVEKSIDKHPNCSIYDEIGEDVMMSICGQAVGVRLFNVHDILNRDRFQYDSPDAFLNFKSYLKLNWRPVELDSNFSYAAPHQVESVKNVLKSYTAFAPEAGTHLKRLCNELFIHKMFIYHIQR
ncbi:Glycoprotein-N-acetylgalactosamine 3-beta-galactosyltransferase 1 [Schistosoma japonicum]|nr:Glycoprotein-N-acetylgalactosamine 3-beta-galactosyltransferase 1 [Schistosoma japonicum]